VKLLQKTDSLHDTAGLDAVVSYLATVSVGVGGGGALVRLLVLGVKLSPLVMQGLHVVLQDANIDNDVKPHFSSRIQNVI